MFLIQAELVCKNKSNSRVGTHYQRFGTKMFPPAEVKNIHK